MTTKISITKGTNNYEFYGVPEKVAKAIITLLHECEKDDSTIVSAISEVDNGKTIDESMKVLQEVPKVMPITKESISVALETMKKYQKIQEIVKEWREVGLDYDSCDAMDNIERVIEYGSN